jgi:hypothetical protein
MNNNKKISSTKVAKQANYIMNSTNIVSEKNMVFKSKPSGSLHCEVLQQDTYILVRTLLPPSSG